DRHGRRRGDASGEPRHAAQRRHGHLPAHLGGAPAGSHRARSQPAAAAHRQPRTGAARPVRHPRSAVPRDRRPDHRDRRTSAAPGDAGNPGAPARACRALKPASKWGILALNEFGGPMQTLHVDLGTRSYPIYIGRGLLDDGALLARHIVGRQVAIVSNETVAPLYLERLSAALAGYQQTHVVLPDGEAHKNWETLQLIFDGMLQARHDRRTTVIALGGGVIGDMAGFAAACYQRGVNFIQVPTTLLSQVDSSVGGKTGINHPLGKNMIGAFYQPQAVLIDTATLGTLPAR